ncbi:MAG: adenylate/guanylate cyclase domain-containing protein [Hyphomicrobiales bacterium]
MRRTTNKRQKIFGQDRNTKRPPKFFVFRIYIFSLFLYFLLTAPIESILRGKDIDNFRYKLTLNAGEDKKDSKQENEEYPYLDKNDSPIKEGLPISHFPEEPKIINIELESDKGSFSLGSSSSNFKIYVIMIIFGYLFNFPFKSYFRRKRKGKRISRSHLKFCKRFIIISPVINACIFAIGFIITNTMFYFNHFVNNIYYQKYSEESLIISIIAALLTILFVYSWEKHRVHIKYLEQIFSPKELNKSIFSYRIGKIKTRLWISSIMTTVLPLSTVLFYVYISISTINDTSVLSLEQKQLLLGNVHSNLDINDLFISNLGYYPYISSIDSVLMIAGVIMGVIVSLIYIYFFLSWTTQDIIIPVSKLLKHVQSAGRGNLSSYTPVTTNDEIGELTQGFNEMTDKLETYFENIKVINEANSRFVPRQFLEYLGKDSIDQINLGDQVQKEMTVMFSDIREFTSISEKMNPKDNFDFLNNYLGIMEPVIHRHHGFIDKFIGDAIMALYPNTVEEAIDSAIEMRQKLIEFNIFQNQCGKQAIKSGIGIHTGNLMLGIVGGEGRMDGTVISDAVNLSARLEGLTKRYGVAILVSEDTFRKIKHPMHYNYRFIDIVKVKGKNEAVNIYEIFDGDSKEQVHLKTKTIEPFNNGIALYQKGEFTEAKALFKDIINLNENDDVANIYYKRCNKYIAEGKPENWNGIEILDSK